MGFSNAFHQDDNFAEAEKLAQEAVQLGKKDRNPRQGWGWRFPPWPKRGPSPFACFFLVADIFLFCVCVWAGDTRKTKERSPPESNIMPAIVQ